MYFLPTTPESLLSDGIPNHPMLKICYSSVQILNSKYSRRLITMRKTARYNEDAVRAFHSNQGVPVLVVDKIHNVAMTKLPETSTRRIPRLRGKNF